MGVGHYQPEHMKKNQQDAQNGQMEQRRQQIDQIMHQETRVATAIGNVAQDKQQYYSVEQTKKEHALIEQVLADPVALQLSDEQRYRLQAIQGRNISHLLLNQSQYSSDSDEMKAVKRDVGALEQLMAKKWAPQETSDVIADDMQQIEGAYQMAIASCKYYCDNKNPSFQKGIERKQMVQETLNHLRMEYRQVSMARRMIRDGQLQQGVTDPKELLVQAQQALAQLPQERQQEQMQPTGVHALSYADFAAMLASGTRGQLRYTDQGLQVTGDGVFSSADRELSADNRLLRERFLAVVQEKLGDQATPELIARFRDTLGLTLDGQQAMALDRKTLYQIITEVNLQSSAVAQTMKEGKQSAGAKHRIALECVELFSTTHEDRELTYDQSEVRQAMRARIEEILGDAKKLGVRVRSLSKEQMNRLLNGNIMLLRDNIFQEMNRVYDGMSHLNNGQDMGLNDLVRDKSVLTRIAAYSIMKMAADTADERLLAEHDLRVYTVNTTFRLAKKTDLQKDFEHMYVGMLAQRGTSGLEDAFEARIPKSKEWSRDPARMKKGYDSLRILCEHLQELSRLQNKGFSEGLTSEEAQRLGTLGTEVQKMVQSSKDGTVNPILSDMEFVARELKGSRFAEGLQQVKKLVVSDGFSFRRAAARIGAATEEEAHSVELKRTNEVKEVKQKEEQAGYDQTMKEAAAQLGELDEAGAQALRVLLLQSAPSELIKKEKDSVSRDITRLHDMLRSFPAGELHAETISFAGVTLQFVQSESGLLALSINHRQIPLPYSARMLAERIETDMIGNERLFDVQNTKNVIQALDAETKNNGELIRTRSLCVRLLQLRTGHPAAFFNNVSVKRLKDYASQLLEAERTPQSIIEEVNQIENSALINGEEQLELIRNQKENSQKVVISQTKPVAADDGPKWTENEQKVQKLLSEVVFSPETWESDERELEAVKKLQEAKGADGAISDGEQTRIKNEQAAGRLQKVLLQNSEALFYALRDPGLLTGMVDKLPLPDGELPDSSMSIKENIKLKLQEFLDMEELAPLKKTAGTSIEFLAKLGFNTAMIAAMGMPAVRQKLAEIEDAITEGVRYGMDSIQQMINDSVSEIFGGSKKEGQQAQNEQQTGARVIELDDEEEKAGEVKEKVEVKDTSSKALEKLLKESATGKRGQGLFIKNILLNYFQNVSAIDQRAMLASALKNVRPMDQGAATEEEKQKAEKKALGTFLAGILKGAGPLLQKTLQGMPLDSMPDELKTALKDMRSNLEPIPEEFVKAQLQGMIDRSNGNITEIEVVRALGAASVGQAFLCRLKGPGLSEEGKEVVVKLLRPDVRNRMMREKQIMLASAKKTDGTEGTDTVGGMEATYQGQLQRIEEELDLTIEARNVERGRIYDKGAATVRSMKVDRLVEPTVNALVLEKAPGTTLDKYMDEARAKCQNIYSQFYQYDEEGELKTDGDGNEMLVVTSKSKYKEARQALYEQYEQLKKRQKYLTEMANKWVTEGIFGAGFYHGDLHAGNIMVDDKGLTVIDFGNATKLDGGQQKQIIKMMLAASTGDMKMFRHGFHTLLQNTPEEVYQQKREELGQVFREIFAMGNAKDTGIRIAVALAKAQELGLELPPAIANFSQSQIRLQQTIEEMNHLMDDIRSQIENMDIQTSIVDASLGYLTEVVSFNSSNARREIREGQRIPSMKKEDFLKAMHAQTEEELARFDKTYLVPAVGEKISGEDAEAEGGSPLALIGRIQNLCTQREGLMNDGKSTTEVDTSIQGVLSTMLTTLARLQNVQVKGAEVSWGEINKNFLQIYMDYDFASGEMTEEKFARFAVSMDTFQAHISQLDRLQNEQDIRRRVDALRQVRKDGTLSEEELSQQEDELYHDYFDAYIGKKIKNNRYFLEPMKVFEACDKTDVLAMEQMKDVYEAETYGARLRETYEAYLDAKALPAEERRERYHAFLAVYLEWTKTRLKEFDETLDQTFTDNGNPDTFFDVMGEVISQNKMAAVNNLGYWYSIKQWFKRDAAV